MVSVLRNLQAQWNALVPQAQALNIRRVRTLNLPLETISYRQAKLDWLRGEIERLTVTTALTPATDDLALLSSMTFGVELECILPNIISRSGMATKIRDAGVECYAEDYNHTTGSRWKIVTDNSLSGGRDGNGAEIVSPALRGQDGFDQLVKVCNALKAAGARVNRSCGLHVHVGAREWQVSQFKNLVLLYAGAQRAIDTFMAPSRRDTQNAFCQPISVNHSNLISADTVDGVARAFGQQPGSYSTRGGARYKKLNLMSFWQHGTVEFRHHQGTVEHDKALNWVKLCLRMCAAARENTALQSALTLDGFLDHVKAPDSEKTFFVGRAQYFTDSVERAATRSRQREERAARERAERNARYRERIANEQAYIAEQARLRAERAERAAAEREANPFVDAGDDITTRANTRGQV